MSSYIYGLATCFSMILSIGAQNAFVIRQGIKQQHIFWVCLFCALSDAILISAGVMGFSSIILKHAILIEAARYFGAIFLIIYAVQKFYSAWYANYHMDLNQTDKSSLFKVLLICASLTWLNPHVYLDTLFLMGAISSKLSKDPFWFALGAITTSVLFFFSLGYGAQKLAPLFTQKISWQILDSITGCIMLAIALALLFMA